MSNSLPEPDRPWRLYIAIGLVVVLVAAGLFFAGGQSPQAETETGGGSSAQGFQQRQCEEQLAGIMRAVDPQELGLSSNQSDRAYDLNLWRQDCGAVLASQAIAEDEALVRKLLPAEVAERTLQSEFTPRDVAHLRTTLLLRQTAEHVAAGETNVLRQAVRLFDYVQRSVLDAGAETLTLTPYEMLLIGRASAEQRAWLLADLLRQLSIDAVIVRPLDPAADRWLLGVMIPADSEPPLYLFDLAAGLPVPAAAEQMGTTTLVAVPATLAEVRADESLLRQLDLPDNPYRWTAADLTAVRIELIGHSSVWSNRVAVLDYAIDVRGARFYDGLGQNRLQQQSLFDRVVAAGRGGGWSAEQVAVWELPESQLHAFGTASAQGADIVAGYLGMLAGPQIIDLPDPVTGANVQWNHPLIKARHLHMTGAYTDAIKEYNQIRGGMNVFTPTTVNDICRESAVYWTAGCQYELGAFDSVLNMGLGGQYPPAFRTPQQPIWADGMTRLTLLSLAHLNQFEAASQVLPQLRAAIPHGPGYLQRRWERLARPAGTAPADAAPGATPPAAAAPVEPPASADPAQPPAPDSVSPSAAPAATPDETN